MSFKLHLLIICIIVFVVFLVWEFTTPASAPPPTTTVVVEPTYSIEVNHASWGLNCIHHNVRMPSNETTKDPFRRDDSSPENKLREDNVLEKISDLCNGKLSCEFPITPAILGDDPQPECTKQLEVEYRCFSYDRPWIASGDNGTLTLNCDKSGS